MPAGEPDSINPIFSAITKILAALERLMRASEDAATVLLAAHQVLCGPSARPLVSHESEISSPLRLRLWLLHVGAFIEQQQQRSRFSIRQTWGEQLPAR